MIDNYHLLFYVIIAFLPILLLLTFSKNMAIHLLLDSRISRIFHYLLLAIFGSTLYVKSYSELFESNILLRFSLFFILLFYAGIFAIVTNNIEDLETDKLTNPKRPLVQSAITLKSYRIVGIVCLIISLLLALLIGKNEFISIASISIIYYFYSVRPFKLKRFVILAKFLIGINSFIVAVYGFCLVGGKIDNFPFHWAFFILIPISLMANFVDLKDTEGDRLARVKTLPVILGNKKATIAIAFFTFISYLFVVLELQNIYVVLFVTPICVLHILLLFREPYSEKPLFFLHNSLFIGLILLILILK